MSVVGLDFGNANNVVALARRKGIDVVLNTESKRETPSMVNFGVKQVRPRGSTTSPAAPASFFFRVRNRRERAAFHGRSSRSHLARASRRGPPRGARIEAASRDTHGARLRSSRPLAPLRSRLAALLAAAARPTSTPSTAARAGGTDLTPRLPRSPLDLFPHRPALHRLRRRR